MVDEQKIVFVVGPDMTGKTEIAHELARRTGMAYFKASSEHETFLDARKMFLNQLLYADPRVADFVKQTRVNVVFDRGYPCEWVYAHTLGRETNDDVINSVDKRYAEMGARIVMCTRSSYEGIFDDLDPSICPSVLAKLDAKYRDYLTFHTLCESMILNVDSEDLEYEIGEIMNFIQAEK